MWNPFIRHHTLISQGLNILYPSQCPVCKNPPDVFNHSPICSSCWSQIKRYAGPSCMICAMPLSSPYSKICGQCLKEAPPFSRVIPYGLYEGVLAEAINQFKFYGLNRLSGPLGKLFTDMDLPRADGIVPVPLSKKGLKERGFNQSLLLARVVSKMTGIPLFMDALVKKKDTPPQIGLSAKERLLNLKNAFEAKGHVKDLRLFLVDDVMTTGATVRECSKQLIKAGSKEVVVLTLARANLM